VVTLCLCPLGRLIPPEAGLMEVWGEMTEEAKAAL